MSTLTPDEMRDRFLKLSPEKQVEFLGKLAAGAEVMSTVVATVQNAIVTLYPTFEKIGELGKELENMLLRVTPKELEDLEEAGD